MTVAEPQVEIISTVDESIISKIAELEKQVFGSGALNQWHLPVIIRHGLLFVLWLGQELAGASELVRDWHHLDKAFIIGFFVAENYQHQGLGKYFLAEILRQVLQENIIEIELTVDERNQAALSVYQQAGFYQVDYLKDEYGRGRHRLLMRWSKVKDER
jgi:ribosomal protein S18 acetylase RimI-like enzyme